MTFDLINGAFELCAGGFVWLNVRRLLKDRCVTGVDWRATGFFTAWGIWNLAYYPSLGQWLSFVGGLCIVAVNSYWLYLVFKLRRA